MQLNEVIEALTNWTQENICNSTQLLEPSESAMSSEYNLVTPKAFALYVPPKDQLPPDVETQVPSVCLQLKEGQDDMRENTRRLKIRFAFSTYRPGSYEEVEGEEGQTEVKFTRNADGWKDIWLWVSKSINKIQTEMYIEGVKVDRTTPIKYGHFTIDDALALAYPMWYAWAEVTVICGISSKANSYNTLL